LLEHLHAWGKKDVDAVDYRRFISIWQLAYGTFGVSYYFYVPSDFAEQAICDWPYIDLDVNGFQPIGLACRYQVYGIAPMRVLGYEIFYENRACEPYYQDSFVMVVNGHL
jgi:hypothetical protein